MDFHYVESFVIHDSGITCPKAEASNGKGDPGPKTMGIWLGMRRNWDLDGFGTFIDQLGYLSVINQFTWWASADHDLEPQKWVQQASEACQDVNSKSTAYISATSPTVAAEKYETPCFPLPNG